MHNTDITLPAFAAERRRLLSIDIYCRLDAQQQTRRMPLLLSINGTDGRADGRTDARPFHRRCCGTMRDAARSV